MDQVTVKSTETVQATDQATGQSEGAAAVASAAVPPVTQSSQSAFAQNFAEILKQLPYLALLGSSFASGQTAAEIQAGAALGLVLENLVQSAMAMHKAALGEPMDLTKLHAIPLLP